MRSLSISPGSRAWRWLWGSWLVSATAGASEISLQDAIDRSMSRSPQVNQAQAELEAQVERKRTAWTNVGPKVAVSYNEKRFGDQQVATFDQQRIVIRDDVTKTGSVTVTQPVTGLIGLIEYGRLTGLQADLSQVNLRKVRRDAGFSAAESYLEAYQAQAQQGIAEISIAAAKSAFQDAQALQRVGRLNQGDLLKFQLALSQAETRAAQARAATQIALVALQMAVQINPGETIELQKDLPKLQTPPPALERGLLTAKDRNELQQATLGAEIAGYNKKIAYAKMVPNVKVFATWDRNFGDVTGLGGEKNSNYVGLSLEWDVWSNGSSIFEVRDALAQGRAADAVLAGAEDAIRLDVVQAWHNQQAAEESMALAQSAVAQAEEAYRIDQTRFKSGQISATDLIKSETDKTNAQGQLVTAQTQLLLWSFRLQKAAGQDRPTI